MKELPSWYLSLWTIAVAVELRKSPLFPEKDLVVIYNERIPGLFSLLLCPSPSLARMVIVNWCPLLFSFVYPLVYAVCWRLPFSVRSFRTRNHILFVVYSPFQGSALRSLYCIIGTIYCYRWCSTPHLPTTCHLESLVSISLFSAEVTLYFSDAKLGCTVAFQVPVVPPYSCLKYQQPSAFSYFTLHYNKMWFSEILLTIPWSLTFCIACCSQRKN